MDKERGFQPDTESYIFLSERDAVCMRSDSLDSGVPLSEVESALAERVRHLKQENKEIRSAIDNYQEALKLCQENLSNMITRQGEMQSDTLQKYNQAKVKVQRQNEKISNLEKQLQEEKNKHSEQEKVTDKIEADKQSGEKKDVEKVDISKQNSLQEKIGSLRQFIRTISTLTPDKWKTSMSPDLLQDLINLSVDMESVRPLIRTELPVPVHENDLTEEVKYIKKQLKQEEAKRTELEIENNELKDLVENKGKKRTDVTEVQEEVKLLNRDMEQIDMIRAGFVSRDSQTTEESFCLDQEQSVDNSLSEEFEKQKQKWKEEKNSWRNMMDQREKMFLKEKEKLLAENEAVKKRVEELQDELLELKVELDKKADDSELAEAVAAKNKIQQELLQQRVQYDSIEKDLRDTDARNKQLELRLSENDIAFQHELKMKENELEMKENELKMKEKKEIELKRQAYAFYEELQAKEQECEDWRARLEISDTECYKMKSALEEIRKELATVYSEHEKLLTDRKAVSGAELGECQSKIDNLTAQLLSAEEMLENKEHDLRNLHEHHEKLASKLETLPLLEQQCDLYKADFNQEKQTREKVEDDNRKLRNEVDRLLADNERLRDEANDPTGSKMAEMQRRHVMRPGNEWGALYDLVPRGNTPGGGARPNPQPAPPDPDINRQVSGGRCPKCDRMFPDLDRLQTHVVECLESESTGSVGGVVCPKCQDSFPDLDTLQIHVMECLDN